MFSLACIHPSLYLKPEMYMVLLIEVFLTQPTLMRYVDLSPFFFFLRGRPRHRELPFIYFFDERRTSAKHIKTEER